MTNVSKQDLLLGLPGATRATSIADSIRSRILEGSIAPGARLRADELKDQFEVSLTPVREALMRLTAEGLVIAEDQRGFRVTPVSRQNLIEVTELRTTLECLALRHSIEKGDLEWETNIVATLHRLDSLNSRRSQGAPQINAQWEHWHREFHFALIAACEMPLLLTFCRTLYDLSDRYRRMSVRAMRQVNRQSEHDAIAAAAGKRNIDLATKLLAKHIGHTKSLIIEAFDLDGGR